MNDLLDQREAAALVVRAAREGMAAADALALFDSLPTVSFEEMTGRWKGGGIATGHPLDGLLEAYGWYGKEFIDPDTVHPLLFRLGHRIEAIDPRWLPLGVATGMRPQRWDWTKQVFIASANLMTTRKPAARLRRIEYRGKTSAAMIYDRQPIIDHFRSAGPDLLLGLMDLRGSPPFTFFLRREA
ncbi:DUF4334 domain-containing protein [Tsuneonella sp. HG222]